MTAPRTWRIAAISFDHVHMPRLLRTVIETPNAELVGICDERRERMEPAARDLSIPEERIFTDYRRCLEVTRPDLVILCPATARHAEWTEKVAEYGVHVFMEKPFASSLAEADRMAAAVEKVGKQLIINWPMVWDPVYVTAKRLIDQGLIGDLLQVHYYGGNRGPVHFVSDADLSSDPVMRSEKAKSWFYQKDAGGGSLHDYLGYGTTLGTWYMDGRMPVEVSCMVDIPQGLEVDEQSVTICRYPTGLSTFQTRWGTLTDPWEMQTQPRAGFVLAGSDGTISAYGHEPAVTVQTRARPEAHEIPVDTLQPPRRNPVEYFLHCLEAGEPVEGPLSPAISRIGQQIVDSALLSAAEGRVVPLVR